MDHQHKKAYTKAVGIVVFGSFSVVQQTYLHRRFSSRLISWEGNRNEASHLIFIFMMLRVTLLLRHPLQRCGARLKKEEVRVICALGGGRSKAHW